MDVLPQANQLYRRAIMYFRMRFCNVVRFKRKHYQLRPGIAATGLQPIEVIQSGVLSKPNARDVDRGLVD